MNDIEKTNTSEEPKKPKRWFKRIIVLSLLFMAFFLIIFTIIARMGGSSEPLRLSIEDYLGDATGMDASIETLNGLHFFPIMIIDFEGVSLTKPGQKEPSITADRVRMAASFFDVLWQTGKFQALGLSHLKAAPNTIMNEALTIEDISIQVPEQDVHADDNAIDADLYMNGAIDERGFTLTVPLTVYKKGQTFRMDTDGKHMITYDSGEKAMVSYEGKKLVLNPVTSTNKATDEIE